MNNNSMRRFTHVIRLRFRLIGISSDNNLVFVSVVVPLDGSSTHMPTNVALFRGCNTDEIVVRDNMHANHVPTPLDGVLGPAPLIVPDHNVGEIVRRYYNLGNRIPAPLDGVLVPALLAVPDHNVGEIVRRYYNLGNHIPAPLDGVLVRAPLPIPDHNIGEILAHGLGEIIALTIIFFVETRFPELLVVDSAACGCASFDSIMLAVFHSSMLGILIGCLSFVVARWMRWV